MPTLIVLKEIAIIIISLSIGFGYYYVMSDDNHKMKKKQLDGLLSLLINFILYIWLGKILLNVTVFIKDPFAVLAYPSNSNALYIATILIGVNILYLDKRKKKHSFIQVHSQVLPVSIVAMFAYEMIQFIVNDTRYNIFVLLFMTMCLLVYTFKKVKSNEFLLYFSAVILITLFIVSFTRPLTTVFGYILSPYYYLILCVLVMLGLYRLKRKV